MRHLKLLIAAAFGVVALVAIVNGRPAQASENYIGNIADGGNLTRCFRPASAGIKNITFQCPGEAVYVCAGNGGFRDAGPGCLAVNFIANPDSYAFPLATSLGQDRICLRDFDAGVLSCNFYQVAQ